MRARRSALGSDNTSTFSAPRASIANQVPIPTGPAPATSAVPPTRTPLRDTACQPTAIGSTSAPIRRSTPSGTPSPTSTTVPENSWPRICGSVAPVRGCGWSRPKGSDSGKKWGARRAPSAGQVGGAHGAERRRGPAGNGYGYGYGYRYGRAVPLR
ncbi:hypothetical protein ACUJ8N_19990 [Streptomyces sp. ESR1.13]|uniref:hypothetical protein n=1 Tax=unclassified Streptomyces TaxID=2593676 RepID=UPI00404125A7